MPSSTDRTAAAEVDLAGALVAKLAARVEALTDRPFACRLVDVARRRRRPAGRGVVHVSFRFVVADGEGGERGGCLLVPYADAVALAGYHLMLPDEVVGESRLLDAPDGTTMEAMLQLGAVAAEAFDRVLSTESLGRLRVRPDGCQGVRAGVRPALRYEEGEELLVVRAEARVCTWPTFDLLLVLPAE